MGTNKKPFYRIVVADQRCSRDGRFIEQLGTYDPKLDPPAIVLDEEKAKKWLSNGAQPSDSVRGLLVKQGLLDPLPRREYAQAAASSQPEAEAGAAEEAEPAAEAAEEQPAEG